MTSVVSHKRSPKYIQSHPCLSRMPQCSQHACLAVVSFSLGCLVVPHPSLEYQPEEGAEGRGSGGGGREREWRWRERREGVEVEGEGEEGEGVEGGRPLTVPYYLQLGIKKCHDSCTHAAQAGTEMVSEFMWRLTIFPLTQQSKVQRSAYCTCMPCWSYVLRVAIVGVLQGA